MKILPLGALTSALAGLGWAQTQLDLRTQSKDVDFSAASSTRPLKTGVVLPATCAVGELFFKSDATAGLNIYECQSTNTWTQQLSSGGGGGGGSDFTGSTAVTSSFSATPTFSLGDVNVRSPVIFQPGIMTANVTAVAFTNLSAGSQFSILWLQAPSGGPFTVTYGASVSSTYPACQVTPTASGWVLQSFKVLADGATVIGTGCIGSDQGISIPGSTSGQIQIKAAAAAGSNVLTLPAGTTDFSATGGVSQVVKQTSAGGALSVARLACADLSDSGTGCSGSGGGGGSPIAAPFWPFGEGSSTNLFTLASANRAYTYQFTVFSPGIQFSKVTLNSNNTGGDVGHWAVGIYNSSLALIANGNSNTVTGDGTGNPHTATFPATLTLTPGVYYMSISSDNTSTKFTGVADVQTITAIMVNDGLSSPNLGIFYCANVSSGTTTITFNANCGSQTAISFGYPVAAVFK